MKAGLTGHQDLGSIHVLNWVKDVLSEKISDYHISHGISCLAVGADQMFAEILNERNIPFTVIVPSKRYEETFDPTGLAEYKKLLFGAQEIVTMNFSSPGEEAYMEAGKEVVNRADILFAVWNGQEAAGLGGTGDVVKYAAKIKRPIVQINPFDQTVARYNF